MAEILPAIFFGHGNPMNAILENGYTKSWSLSINSPATRSA
jgi:4,5-DOPA dioxygenase extradiol